MIDYSNAFAKVPNQKFNTNINGHTFEFEFRTFRGIMYANVLIDSTLVDAGVRCMPNQSLFPGKVNYLAGGIFQFKCLDGAYPSYEGFDGTTCRFVYIPNSEL